jgi:hypothetical protein
MAKSVEDADHTIREISELLTLAALRPALQPNPAEPKPTRSAEKKSVRPSAA